MKNKDEVEIRLICDADIPKLLDIYRHYVLYTSITFETDVPSLSAFESRLKNTHACLCICIDAEPIGFAYAGRHRAKQAYDTVCESTIYLSEDQGGKGYGYALYSALGRLMKTLGYHSILGGLTVPNAASVALHKRCGYEYFCTYENIGYKQGAWHTVDWMRLDLNSFEIEPMPVTHIEDLDELELAEALK